MYNVCDTGANSDLCKTVNKIKIWILPVSFLQGILAHLNYIQKWKKMQKKLEGYFVILKGKFYVPGKSHIFYNPVYPDTKLIYV